MYYWLSVLILSAQSPAPMEHRGAEPVFATSFEQDADTNFDAWPDGWTRRRSAGFPQYLPIAIVDDPDGKTLRCLRIELDGGAAAVYSPPIEIDPMFNYVLQGKLKTRQLQHDVAYYSVTFYDSNQEQKESYTSPELTDVPQWQDIQIGPLTPSHLDVRFAVIGLHVGPTQRADLHGAAMFDDICLSRLPRMSITSRQPHNVFFDAQQVELTCSVSGIRQPNPTMHLEMLDEMGRSLATETLPMVVVETLPMDVVAAAEDPLAWLEELWITETFGPPQSTGYAASLTWRPPVPGYGFYTVRAALRQEDGLELQHAVSFVVMRPTPKPSKSEYGWSLTSRMPHLATQPMLKLLELAHVSWLKYPVWCDPTDEAALDQLVALAGRLEAADIKMVGVFDEVPPDGHSLLGNKEHPSVADAFLEPGAWQPLIDPLMVRLSTPVHYWQLGRDGDDSLVDVEGLEGMFRSVQEYLEQSGYRVRLGLAWPWIYEVPVVANAPWDFLALSEAPPFTHAELERSSSATMMRGAPRWITLRSLPKLQYAPDQRARDLVLRMLAAKTRGMMVIFASDPFDDSRGLVNQDGTPSELFLPWCITAEQVGGAEYLGSMALPHGSHNYVFVRNGEAVMVVWNENPVNETLYLGDQVRQLDLWGRECSKPLPESSATTTQTFTAGPLPTFLTGLHLEIARWQVNCVLEPSQLLSVSGIKQAARLQFRNTFPRSVRGSATLHVPAMWDVREGKCAFRLAEKESRDEPLEIVLQADACTGPQRVRIDFEIEADQRYQFSVYREVQVGSGDLVAELNSRLDDEGQLIVEQSLTNNTAYPLNLNCYLYAPGRRRERQQVLNMEPGRVTRSFVLPNGQELMGQPLWLQVEEIGGKRVLNYQVVTQP